MPLKDAELIAIFGRRGSGKSTAAKALAAGAKKLIVFDVQAEYSGRGYVRCETREEVKRAMLKGWRRGFKISYVPPAGDEIKALHWLAQMARGAQQTYIDGRDTRKLTLVIEEAHTGLPVTPLPAKLSGMIEVIRRGRHWGIEAVAVTQRPASLNPDFRANASRTYVFPLADHTSRKTVLNVLGPEHGAYLRDLRKFSFMMVSDGHVQTGKVSKTNMITLD